MSAREDGAYDEGEREGEACRSSVVRLSDRRHLFFFLFLYLDWRRHGETARGKESEGPLLLARALALREEEEKQRASLFFRERRALDKKKKTREVVFKVEKVFPFLSVFSPLSLSVHKFNLLLSLFYTEKEEHFARGVRRGGLR